MAHARTDRKPAHNTLHPSARRKPWHRPRREEDSESMTVAQIARSLPPHFTYSRVSGVLATLGLRRVPSSLLETPSGAAVAAPHKPAEESVPPFCGKSRTGLEDV